MKPIPYGRQFITDDDIQAVTDVLKSDFLTQGPKILEFEEAFAKYIGCKYAVAVSNGTAALHLSALALHIQPGDKVITTPITFVASANCVRYCGGEIVFADIDPITYLLDVNSVRALLHSSPKGTYKGIIPVDFAGYPVNMEEYRQLADEYGLWILEDACHAPGGYFTDSLGNSQMCGNGKFADLAIFSFHPVKHIATGEGGMITTNNIELYKQLLLLRTHGIIKQPSHFQNSIHLAIGYNRDKILSESMSYPGWYYEMQELGYNYRLTDFQAALGLNQLKRADTGLARRREIAAVYFEAFKGKPYIIGQSALHLNHAYHLYIIEIENRLELYEYLKNKNIFCQVHYIPVHIQPYYNPFGSMNEDFPFSERYYTRCLSIPMFPSMKDEEQQYVIDCINDFFEQ